jgi:hypothetical protein
MANDLTTRQWRLDTPTPFSAGPQAILWQSTLYVKAIEFTATGIALGESRAVIKDRTGRVVWESVAVPERMPTRLSDIGWVNGLVLDTLSPGTLVVVYIK